MQTKCRTDIEKIMRKCTVIERVYYHDNTSEKIYSSLLSFFFSFFFFFLKDIYLRRTIGLYFQSWISPYIGPPAEALYKFTSLFCESLTLTVSSVESTQQIQTSTEVNLCSISVCFYKYGFWNTLFISVLPQKILKSVIQCLQTSTIVALCWAPFFTAWFHRVLVNLRSLCPCQQPKPFLIAAGSGSTQPLLSAHVPQCPRMGWISRGTGKLLLALLLTHLSQHERPRPNPSLSFT